MCSLLNKFLKVCFVCHFVLWVAPPCFIFAEEKLVDRVVAVVNQDVITQSELDALFQPLVVQFREVYQGQELMEKLNEVRKKLITQLIEDRLVLQEAKKLGIEVSEGEVNGRLEELKGNFASGGSQHFEDALKAQGVTLKSVKERINDQIAIQKLHYVEVRRKVVVSPLEIEKYYNEHKDEFIEKEKIKVWTIMISKGEEAIEKGMMDEAAKKKMEAILKELRKGKDFSELAKRESKDPHAKDGGLIGYVSRGDMIGKIDEILFKLPDSQFSDILETERAYHIFKVADRQPSKELTLDEARERIQDVIYKRKATARFEVWMDELKKNAFISIR